jgi:hypothetical protein
MTKPLVHKGLSANMGGAGVALTTRHPATPQHGGAAMNDSTPQVPSGNPTGQIGSADWLHAARRWLDGTETRSMPLTTRECIVYAQAALTKALEALELEGR